MDLSFALGYDDSRGSKFRVSAYSQHQLTGLSLRAGGRGFSLATKRVAPGYFYWKIEPKEIPSRLIPRLLVVFTWQLEILVTTLGLFKQ